MGLIIIILVAGYYLLKDNLTEWSYNLDKTKTNPYGTFLTYNLLKNKYRKNGFIDINTSVVQSFRKLNLHNTYNYIFLNQTPYYDSAVVDTLCKFTEAGNTVFISCESLYGSFLDSVLHHTYHLKLKSAYDELYFNFNDSERILQIKNLSIFNFTDPALKNKNGYPFYLKNKGDTIVNYYYNFDAIPDSEKIYPIPNINSISFKGYEKSYGVGLNFAVLKHGKGQFVILLSALPFTNYFMRSSKGLEYAERVFAYLPDQPTLWDNVSHEYKYTDSDYDHGDSSYGNTPLYFILKNKELRWAWYLTIMSIIIYAVFHAKRRQHIIPILTAKQNTSLKYVETIGQLYFHEEEHIEIANEMRLQFMNYLRRKYYLKTNETDDTFYKQLSLKSGIEIEKIQALFEEFNDILKIKSIPQKKLHHLNEQLEYFYKHSK